jgi:glycosyltransferase involved in cell wall biosynthesis
MILVSIIVPCYNQSKYLGETLESILVQTHSNWECIIINDGSIDNTEQVVKQYQSKDIRFKYLYQDNQGLAAARNAGIAMAQGEYILPLDGDDLISATYVEEAVPILTAHNEIKIVYCKANLFGEKTGDWDLSEFSGIKNFLLGNSIFCSGMFRKVDYGKTSGYNVNMCYGLEDWDFWISLLKNGGKVFKIPSVHFFYRIKQNSMSTILNTQEARLVHMKNQVVKNHIDLYLESLGNPIDLYVHNLELKNTNKYLLNSKDFKIGRLFLNPYRKIKKFYNLLINRENLSKEKD